MKPDAIVETALGAARHEAVVRVMEEALVNLRWANSTTTTNGVTTKTGISVAAIVDGRVGTVSASLSGDEDVAAIVRAAEEAAEAGRPAEDRMPLPTGDGTPPDDWQTGAVPADPSLFAPAADRLDEVFRKSRAESCPTYGYAEHDATTVWLGTTAGIRRRASVAAGSLSFTTKDSEGRSTWGGQWVADWASVDPVAMYGDMRERLDVARRRFEMPAGRYDVILTPSATADVLTYFFWLASLRDAVDGRSAFSKPGGGTRLGERLSETPITLSSDPAVPGIEGLPFVASTTSGAFSSVFDAGMDADRFDLVRDGVLERLVAPRAVAERNGVAPTSNPSNVIMSGGTASLEDLVAGTERALLVNALWYIRLVDPKTMLLTGLTRDGVYLVEDGAIRGEVNNFRWNVSPLDVLANVREIGMPVTALPREFETSRAQTPPLRVADWNMSSVSEAS